MKARLARWSLIIQKFNFDIEYIKGEVNYSDHLSRDFRQINLVKGGKKEGTKQIVRKRGYQFMVF